MSVRTYDPKEAEIFKEGSCSELRNELKCWIPYNTICKLCNRAFCFNHLNFWHTCDTHTEFLVLTPEEVHELNGNGVLGEKP
jgi:hypothetical protein